MKEGYQNNPICPCFSINKSQSGFAIIIIYVDDLNITKTSEELSKTIKYLKKEFEMKDLRKNKILPWFANWAFSIWDIYLSVNLYSKNLKKIYIDKAHQLIPMQVRCEKRYISTSR